MTDCGSQDNLERYLQLLTVHRTSIQMDRQSAALRNGMEHLDGESSPDLFLLDGSSVLGQNHFLVQKENALRDVY